MLVYAFKVAIYEFFVLLTELIRLLLYWLSFFFRPFIKKYISYEFQKAGIQFDGDNEYDIRVKDARFWSQAISSAVFGFIDSYCSGYIECDNILECIKILTKNKLMDKQYYHPYVYINCALKSLINLQNENHAFEDEVHAYDKHAKLQHKWMSVNGTKSCLYFKYAKTMEEAAEHQKSLIARKLKLKKGMRVLDINCGFGGLAKFIAANYTEVTVVAITASEYCARITTDACEKFKNVQVKQMDYKKIASLGKFDRIVCVEMIEHIGVHNYRKFFNTVNHCLTDNGLFLLQASGVNNDGFFPMDDIIFSKYCEISISFPRFEDIVASVRHTFLVEDWQNIGGSYAKTCAGLFRRLQQNKTAVVKEFDEEMYRWCELSSALPFASYFYRKTQLWQIVLSKQGIVGGYFTEC